MSTLGLDLHYRAGARTLHSALESNAARIAIVGVSGVGKTSLLRAVLGLDEQARGTVALHGHRIDTLPVEARILGWVPQEALLFPHLDVRRNLGFAESVDLDRVATMLGLQALLDRDVGKLSGGERQRVAIGRALLRGPRMLVLDEPLSALDRDARRAVVDAIEQWRVVFDFAVLLASHDEIDVAALADEVYAMSEDGTLTRRSSTG